MADEESLAVPGRAAGEALKTGSSTEQAGAPGPARRESAKRPAVPETAALFFVLVALIVFFAVTSKFFLNADNLINILQNVARIGIIAGPATLLLISGQFDLSVGSIAAFSAMVMAVLAGDPAVNTKGFAFGLPLEVAFVGAMVAALLVGVLNAISVTVFRINALITTLGTLAIFRGLTKVLGNGQTIVVDNFDPLGTTRILGLPLPVYFFFGISFVTYVVLRYTTYGRSMYAIGASPTAARLAGIRTNRSIFIGFVLTAGLAGFSGLILLSQVAGASINANIGLELSVITAVILGGASLSGGRGGIIGTTLAVLIVGVLGNGLIQLGVPTYWIEVANGVLLLVAVGFDQLRIRLTNAGS